MDNQVLRQQQGRTQIEEQNNSAKWGQALMKLAVTTAAVAGLFAFKPNDALPESITLTLIMVAVLPWVGSFVREIRFPGGGGLIYESAQVLQATTKDLTDVLAAQQAALRHLVFLVRHSLPDAEIEHLRNLLTGEFVVDLSGDPAKGRDAQRQRGVFFGDFRQQISKLINLGFIQYQNKNPDLFDENWSENQRRVNQYCTITKSGREYLAYLDEIATMERGAA